MVDLGESSAAGEMVDFAQEWLISHHGEAHGGVAVRAVLSARSLGKAGRCWLLWWCMLSQLSGLPCCYRERGMENWVVMEKET